MTRISDKIDELLADDKNFDTRAGLRLYAELVSDAFAYIEDREKKDKETDEERRSFIFRLTNVENALHDFMEKRTKEQEQAQAERIRWRWALITPTIGLFFTTLGILISLWIGR